MKRLLSLIVCIALLPALFGCRGTNVRSYGSFYYYRTDIAYADPEGVLASEIRELPDSDLRSVLGLYLQGPETDGLVCPIPAGTALLGWSLTDGSLTLDFDKNLAALTGIELTIASGCLARTFLELTGADTLVLTADGALLDGKTSLTLSASDLMLYDDTRDRILGEAIVYYADAQRRYLVGHSTTVDLTNPEEIPGYLLEQLLQPPNGSGLSSPLPKGTLIRSVTVADGLCTVDLSKVFENRCFYARSAQLLSLAGVVNTLTELDQVDRVEFCVDGDLLIRYGVVSISEPLQRDTRLIGPVRTALGESDASVYLVHSPEGGLLEFPVRIRRTNAVSREELVMRALLADPGTNGIASRIPSGTALNTISLDGGICNVDLSAEYLSSPGDLLWSGRAIAATLCAIEGIDGVQITVNGSIPEDLDSAFFGPLTPEKDWFL